MSISRSWRLLAVAGLAAVVVAVAAVASSSSSSSSGESNGRVAHSTLFRGIPERGGVLGDPAAPVTLTEYLDLQCPVCAAASRETLPSLVRDYVRSGKVKLEARTLSFIGPDSQRAARVAFGAEQQGRLWPFLEAFYAAQGPENSGYVTDGFLRSVAAASGVNAGAVLATADTAASQDSLNRANSDATRLGIDATPTFTVARGNGKPQVVDATGVAAAIRRELGR